jgi:hypothetical protein
VAEETGATVNTAVSTTAQAKSMTTCAAEGVMPTCGTRLALNSGFAAVAPITGGQAEETDTRTVGSSARIDGRQSGSKRTASAHSSGSCICSKRRAGCGGDHADPGPIPAQHILPSASDALQERGPCGQTAARLNQLSELTNRVSCQNQNQPPELAVRPSSPTRPSHSLVRVQNSCLSSLSESATTLACPSQPSESYARASRVDPRPTSADQADYPSQAIELAAPIGRLHQLSDGTARAHPDRPGRPSRSSNSGLQSGCQSQSSKSAVRVSRPRQSSKSAVPAGHPSQPSESATPVNRPSHQPESAVRVSSPNQQSGIIARGHQQPCLSSESAVHTSHLARLMTSRPVRESISVDRVEETPQPTGPTRGTVPAMPVLSPAIRPVDPRRPKQRKRPLTVSASHTFDTNDPLQEPPRKRQQIPTARDNDLWTQWRNLAQDGRRST